MLKNSVNSKGFTLVETAIVLIIGGLLLTMLFSSLNIYLKNTRLSTTRERLAAIDEQIQIYLNDQGRLPCPAELGGVVVTDARYGFETDCNNPAIDNATFESNGVRIGMVPTRTLNLPDEYAYDAWGGKLRYAVSIPMAINPDTYDPRTGARIVVVDNAVPSNVILDPASGNGGHYVIISHGIDQAGSYSNNGILINPCSTIADNPRDQENCDLDNRFRNTLLVSDAGGANNFDDIVITRSTSNFSRDVPPEAVLLFRLSNCPNGWASTGVPSGAPANYIYCRKN